MAGCLRRCCQNGCLTQASQKRRGTLRIPVLALQQRLLPPSRPRLPQNLGLLSIPRPPKAPLGQQPRASLAQFATMSQARPAVALPDGDTEPRWYRSHTGHKHCKKSGRRMVYCLCCGGVGLCVHGKQKYKCQECRGASLCVHLNQKSRCRKCKMANVPGCGSGICPHNREKWRCNDCKS